MSRNCLSDVQRLCRLGASLRVLILSYNTIKSIATQYFEDLTHLQKLFLDRNELSTLPNLIYLGKSLTHLDLSCNKLDSLEEFKSVYSPWALMYVNARHNQLDHLDMTIFTLMPQLLHFDISHNYIKTLQDPGIRLQEVIDIGYNPWHCDGELSWMTAADRSFVYNLTCASPRDLQGKAIADMGKYNYTIIKTHSDDLDFCIRYASFISR